jgi:hypothetical protein
LQAQLDQAVALAEEFRNDDDVLAQLLALNQSVAPQGTPAPHRAAAAREQWPARHPRTTSCIEAAITL